MPVKYKDYYKLLGVTRKTSQDEIQKAYRKLARKYHPDVNKEKGAEAKFKEITEAYEVIGDSEKRKRYDQLGSSWKSGQNFRPPPGWENSGVDFNFGPGQQRSSSGFSDFFDSLFGNAFGGGFRAGPQCAAQVAGRDHEGSITVAVEDLYNGGKKSVKLTAQGARGARRTKTYDVTIPKGILPGQKIRLAGQGGKSMGGGKPGNLYLKVELAHHPKYRVEGRDIYFDLPLAPWEAALGTEVMMETLAGDITLKIPVGTSSGKKLRLRGKGLHNPRGNAGNMFAVVTITVPAKLSPRERELYEQLRKNNNLNPRG